MGISGSDVARDAAAVVLMDDNFASIVVGVREGRTIFDNLTKTIAYTCTHLWPEAVPVILTLAFGFPLALSAMLILTIDLFTELPPAISLAYEPSEDDVMSRPPRNARTDRLVTKQVVMYVLTQAGVIETLCCLMGYFLVFAHYGIPASSLYNSTYFQPGSEDMPEFAGCLHLSDRPNNGHGVEGFPQGQVCYTRSEQQLVLRQAQTCYFALLTTAQMAHIWLCKARSRPLWQHGAFRNQITLYGVAVELCLIVLIIFPPFLNDFLTSLPFPPHLWPLLFVAPIALSIWQEGRKMYVQRYPNSWIAAYVHW
jgi:sodium/potassium-transporting ATPase subunit alpha